MQVLQSAWVITLGGAIAKPLSPDVARGAANTAALRRRAPPAVHVPLTTVIHTALPCKLADSQQHRRTTCTCVLPLTLVLHRRMRTMHHGLMSKQALQPLPSRKVAPDMGAPTPDSPGTQPRRSMDWSNRLDKQRQAASKTRGYRCAAPHRPHCCCSIWAAMLSAVCRSTAVLQTTRSGPLAQWQHMAATCLTCPGIRCAELRPTILCTDVQLVRQLQQ